MKSNADKCHILVSRNANVTIKTGNLVISNTRREKNLGDKFDQSLIFDDQFQIYAGMLVVKFMHQPNSNKIIG